MSLNNHFKSVFGQFCCYGWTVTSLVQMDLHKVLILFMESWAIHLFIYADFHSFVTAGKLIDRQCNTDHCTGVILFYILNNQEVYIFYTHTHTEIYAEKEKHKTTSDEAKIVRRIRALTGKKGRELSVAERDASLNFFFFLMLVLPAWCTIYLHPFVPGSCTVPVCWWLRSLSVCKYANCYWFSVCLWSVHLSDITFTFLWCYSCIWSLSPRH